MKFTSKTMKKVLAVILSVVALMTLLTVAVAAEDVATQAPAGNTMGDTIAEMVKGLFSGSNLALLGIALAVALPCMGSAKGVGIVGEAATGLLSEQPDMFGKAFPVMALPMTQGVYGLVASFMMLLATGVIGDNTHFLNLTFAQGGYFVMTALPIALAGYFSAVRQGRVAAAGINLIGKRPGSLGQAITTAALVETYAIFSLLITIMLVINCPFSAL